MNDTRTQQAHTPAEIAALERKIYEVLGDHKQWTRDKHTLTHVPSGVQLWTANGEDFFAVYKPIPVEFSADGKQRLWSRVQGMLNQKRRADAQIVLDAFKADAVSEAVAA